MNQDANRRKALDMAVASIEKNYGKGAIMRLGADVPTKDVAVISTGAISLDVALGIGGIPRGRVVEIFGPESSGKTTLALHIIAEAQKQGGVAAFIDAEHALDAPTPEARRQHRRPPDLPARHGGAGAGDRRGAGAQRGAGRRGRRLRGGAGPQGGDRGGDGRRPAWACRRASCPRRCASSRGHQQVSTSVIFINQMRRRSGVMFGNPETTTGGNALKFYASIRLDIRRISADQDGEEVIGFPPGSRWSRTRWPRRSGRRSSTSSTGRGSPRRGKPRGPGRGTHKVVDKSGAWYAYGSERIGQGRENAKRFLQDNPAMADEIEAKLRAALG
jgi:recombination protein RecA